MKQNILLFVFLVFCFSFTQILNAQGIIKDDFLVNDDTGIENQFVPAIAMDPAGNFVVVWQDFRDGDSNIYFQRFNNAGTALGVNTKVNDDTQNAAQEYPKVVMDAAGDFVIMWDDNRSGNSDVYYQRYTSTGGTLGVNTKVNDDTGDAIQWDASISMDAAGYFVIVWIDERNGNRDIYFQRYTSTGGALGVNTLVNDDASTADQIAPSILIDVTGNFVIVWHDFRNDDWDIYYQRYTSTGGPLGINTKVNDDAGTNFQLYPTISMDAVGNFVIVWQDFRNANYDIYFQRYTSTGGALGSNIKVNDDVGTMHQKIPEISMDTVGDFVIVWLDDRYGQTDHDIIGQRYFSNGNPNGGNYLIVANGPNNGVGSPVVFADNSNIIFSWEDNRRSQGRDIYAKIVNWNWNGATDVDEIDENIPEEFSLSQNYPNPFNPTTKIKFTIPSLTLSGIEGSPTTLKINDVLGNEIITLVNEELSAGEYEIEFDAKGLTSGIYFYQLKAGNYLETEKMILLK
ncbi:MAG: T9SS type A sorting domain-containing protein [Ignavibacteria bacterium]|nr:T9SS type A sorting domain-containing protein [Ignavibacteria bacterium]